MTEHVQLEIITAVTMLAGQAIVIWRAELAARRATDANTAAVQGNNIAAVARTEQAAAIEQVHQAVNGGLAAAKNEINSLKAQLVVARAADADPGLRIQEGPTRGDVI